MENVATISHRLLSRNARTRCGIPPMVSKDPEVPLNNIGYFHLF